MKKAFLCCLLLFALVTAKADTVYVADLARHISLKSLQKVVVAEVPISNNYKLPPEHAFKPFLPNYKSKSKHAYWLKITLKNNSGYRKQLYINNTMCDYTFLYRKEKKSLIKLSVAGRLVANSELPLKYNFVLLPIDLEENTAATYYLLAYNQHVGAPHINFQLYNHNNLLFDDYRDEFKETVITLFFFGAFSFLSLFMLFMYRKSGQRIYLFYALYLIGAILYSLTRLSPITLIGAWLGNFPVWRIAFNEPAQFIFFAMYNLFAIELLDAKKQDPFFAKILQRLAIVYVLYALAYYLFNTFYLNQQMRNILFNVHRILLFPINILLVVRCIYKIKSPVLGYFVTGMAFFMTASLLAVFSVLFMRNFDGGEPIKAINIFQIGLMLEALCFAFALGYKIKLAEQEKKESQQALILQLEANQLLTKQTNAILEEKVKLRTQELLLANQKIEEKKAKEVKDFFEKKLAQAETMALRSQMNPHFLFNSLNAIKYLIQTSESKMAISYLTKFSRLVRMVLEHSKTELISLEAELEALRLYLEIESKRLGEQFHYEIKIAKSISTSGVQIPPMLLQPFVENAIWHGLLNSNKPHKVVNISLQKIPRKNGIICQIIDNGIGREKASLIKRSTMKSHQSFGMALILDRVKLFNLQPNRKIEVSIDDVIENEEIDGTNVIIKIYETTTD